MGRMEEIYTVHVKSRPDPSQNYPSERCYSSSTVGGFAFSHLALGIIGAVLYGAAYSNNDDLIGWTALDIGCVLASVAGLLACKRWYEDRNIRWFFIASIVSSLTSLTSISLMIYYIVKRDPLVRSSPLTDPKIGEIVGIPLKVEIHIHIVLTSLLEFLISIFSIHISWKGIRNTQRRLLSVRTDGVGGYANDIRPDILQNHDNKESNYSNVVKELYKLQKSTILANDALGNQILAKFYMANPHGDHLPEPESQKEYKERMDKFLASEAEKEEH